MCTRTGCPHVSTLKEQHPAAQFIDCFVAGYAFLREYQDVAARHEITREARQGDTKRNDKTTSNPRKWMEERDRGAGLGTSRRSRP